jgi:hypothetical protein
MADRAVRFCLSDRNSQPLRCGATDLVPTRTSGALDAPVASLSERPLLVATMLTAMSWKMTSVMIVEAAAAMPRRKSWRFMLRSVQYGVVDVTHCARDATLQSLSVLMQALNLLKQEVRESR